MTATYSDALRRGQLLRALTALTEGLLDFIEDNPTDGNSARQELLEETRAVIALIKRETA